MTNDEDGQVGVAALHQVNVLQGVSDVNLEVFDVHSVAFTLTVAHCGGREEREEIRVIQVRPAVLRGFKLHQRENM